MQSISVGKKVWLLLSGLMLALLLAGGGMTWYIAQVKDGITAQIRDSEERIRLATVWSGQVHTASSYLVASMVASQGEMGRYLEAQYGEMASRMESSAQQMQARITTEAGQAQLATIQQARRALQAAVEGASVQRGLGMDITEAIRAQITPAVQAYVLSLEELVRLQDSLLEQVVADGAAQNRQALLLGGLSVAAILLVGLLAARWLVRQLTQPLGRAVELANAIAAGDLTRDVHDSRRDELGELLRSLNTMTQRLRSVVGEVRSGVESVSTAASEIASGNHDLSSRTEQTASNLEETAASIEQLSATVAQSADTARQANQLASTAVQAAERGGEVMAQVVSSMQEITKSSHKISDIIGVIDGIAFQTNILALNAAVEAARAGEQGRGFAVVAGEVRNLAGRSAEAAKEIKQLISNSVSNVDQGSSQVAQAGESMHAIVASVRRVTDLIGEITAATREQSEGFGQVNQAVNSLDQMTQQNAALVEEASAAAHAMSQQAQHLADVVAVFQVGSAVEVRRSAAPALAPVDVARAGEITSGSPAAALATARAQAAAAAETAAATPTKPVGPAAAAPALEAPTTAAAAGASSATAARAATPGARGVTGSKAAATASAEDEWESF